MTAPLRQDAPREESVRFPNDASTKSRIVAEIKRTPSGLGVAVSLEHKTRRKWTAAHTAHWLPPGVTAGRLISLLLAAAERRDVPAHDASECPNCSPYLSR